MILSSLVALAGLALSAAGAPPTTTASEVVSTGAVFDLKKAALPEGTTVLVFTQATSAIERQFVADLGKSLPLGSHLALRVVRLQSLRAPAAGQFQVKSTPTAVVVDRWGHILGRSEKPDEIRAAVRKGMLMARIRWIDEDDPLAPSVYHAPPQAIRRGIAGIVKTMGLRPDAMQVFMAMSDIHFSDGFLKRREHELIAAYVSALNKCKF
jgi:hypothetical protein